MNGKLLDAADSLGFDVRIKFDRSIPGRQNFAGGKLAVVVLCGPANLLGDLDVLAEAASSVIGPGNVVRIR